MHQQLTRLAVCLARLSWTMLALAAGVRRCHMTEKTTKLIEQAINDRTRADGARKDVADQEVAVKAADDKLNDLNGVALSAHEDALASAHAAIDALTGEIES